jgi:hypothetical protein
LQKFQDYDHVKLNSDIRWEFVLDFDSRPQGMLESLKESTKKSGEFWDPKVLNTSELKDLMMDDNGTKFRENIEFGIRTTWIKANLEDPTYPTWLKTNRSQINNFLLQVTSIKAVGNSRYFLR